MVLTMKRLFHVVALALLSSTSTAFMGPPLKTNSREISTTTKMARAADICPEVPLTPKPDTEIVLVALG